MIRDYASTRQSRMVSGRRTRTSMSCGPRARCGHGGVPQRRNQALLRPVGERKHGFCEESKSGLSRQALSLLSTLSALSSAHVCRPSRELASDLTHYISCVHAQLTYNSSSLFCIQLNQSNSTHCASGEKTRIDHTFCILFSSFSSPFLFPFSLYLYPVAF